MKKILFILKKGCDYGFDRKFSGLYNSTKFVVDDLNATRFLNIKETISAKIVQVQDNNSIDREVTLFKPDIVVIEALWVVPEKFDVLKKLHPKVKWFIHLHSDVTFISNEGIAIEWIKEYLKRRVKLILNSKELLKAIEYFLPRSDHELLEFLANCYPAAFSTNPKNLWRLHVGCFGAIRPLKNQLIQAMAAMKVANDLQKRLFFHINANRIEGAPSVLRNLRALFEGSGHVLIEHKWTEHHKFIELLKGVDAHLQVSFSETFNVASADALASGVPVVGSKEIEWLAKASQADCNSIDDIVKKLKFALKSKALLRLNQLKLWLFARRARKMWIAFVLSQK